MIMSDVTVTYRRGLPVITVPLPSRRERCRFTLRPVSQTVGDLLEQQDGQFTSPGLSTVRVGRDDRPLICASSLTRQIVESLDQSATLAFIRIKTNGSHVTTNAAALAADDRVRIAASDTVESLLENDFRLIINDTEYYVKSPSQIKKSLDFSRSDHMDIALSMLMSSSESEQSDNSFMLDNNVWINAK
ncbi:hypothetical protein MSG28_000162 [Choristoneura fumiferana]|uniref:Uncharacterized protein n=1 Tax=Choristoneura fumiferana TaxID=7141 RepID=A0ACC0JZD2_CHOFU|nr:hypothetical protein MSG28_000162 [Choristoneura fumiferana]